MGLFVIEKIRENGIRKVIVRNDRTKEYFSVVPEFGANLSELDLRWNGENIRIIDGYKKRDEFIRNEGFKNIIMVPFPNRVRDGEYRFNGRKYRLPINDKEKNNSLHGLVYSMEFEVVKEVCKDSYGSLMLKLLYDRVYEGYPFKFELYVEYILRRDASFEVSFRIVNADNLEIPMGLGWHPVFELGCRIDSLMMKLPTRKMFVLDERMIPNGAMVDFDEVDRLVPIGTRSFDSVFFIDGERHRAVSKVVDKARGLSLEVWQEAGEKKFNFLQVYTPPDRMSIAIEPMTCNIDAFNNHIGLVVMEPGEEIFLRCGVRLR